ncbi:MAG: GNAT family N-acetyltransferase [Armatimonadetes bacterium]|nr:GNAT family N-acetyltransferase [Armatimonadota bacterium]
MSEQMRERTPAEIEQGIYDSWSPFWHFYAKHMPLAWWSREEDALFCSYAIPHPLFNQVADVTPNLSRERVAQVCAKMEERGLPWLWLANPAHWNDTTPQWLPEYGLIEAGLVKGMAFDIVKTEISRGNPAGLEIREVQCMEDTRAFWAGILPAYEMPLEFAVPSQEVHQAHGFYPNIPIRVYYGVWQGQPVAGSMVYFDKEFAVIQCVGTTPEARGRGFAPAVVSACIQAAKEEGYRYVVLQASDMGYPIYLKMGFTEYFDQTFYVKMPP